MLRPILEAAQELGITYCWGFPLSATFRQAQHFFILRTKADLPAFFTFMDIAPSQYLTVSSYYRDRPPNLLPRDIRGAGHLDCNGTEADPELLPLMITGRPERPSWT